MLMNTQFTCSNIVSLLSAILYLLFLLVSHRMPLPLSSSKKSSKPITLAASKGMHGPGSQNESMEEVDSSLSSSAYSPSPTLMFDLPSLLERLYTDPGYMALLSGKELELLAEMDLTEGQGGEESNKPDTTKYGITFLHQIQEAADRHLTEKNEIRDALGLLKIYHQAHTAAAASSTSSVGPMSSGSPVSTTAHTGSTSIAKPSNSSGNNGTSSGSKVRKGASSGPSKPEGCTLSKLKPKAEASPNKRRREKN